MKVTPLAWTESPFLAEGDLFLGAYRVLREIGKGGMGAVYEVIDELGTRHRFALKVLDPRLASNAEFRRRFAAEATITANVSSNHVAKVIRTGIDVDTALSYILMELIQGTDLGGRIRPGRGLAPEYALMLLRQAASALDTLHRHGIIHRDLKPENLVVALSDDLVPVLKIVDFGIAKIVADHAAPATTAALGTLPFQAPEQMVGDRQIGPAADRYALAHLAFSLLTGQPYWLADRGDHWTAARIFQTMKQRECIAASARVDLLNDYLRETGVALAQLRLPAAFDAWFAKATEFYPEERFDSSREMIDELARALEPVLRSHDGARFVPKASDPGPLRSHDDSELDPSKSGRVLRRDSSRRDSSHVQAAEALLNQGDFERGAANAACPTGSPWPSSGAGGESVPSSTVAKSSTKLWLSAVVLITLGTSCWWMLSGKQAQSARDSNLPATTGSGVTATAPAGSGREALRQPAEPARPEEPVIVMAARSGTSIVGDAQPGVPRPTKSQSVHRDNPPSNSQSDVRSLAKEPSEPTAPTGAALEPPQGPFR